MFLPQNLDIKELRGQNIENAEVRPALEKSRCPALTSMHE
jgi:hypothetical protein